MLALFRDYDGAEIDFAELPAAARLAFARAVNHDRAPLAKRAGRHRLAIAGIVALVAALLVSVGDAEQLIEWNAIGFVGLVGAVVLYCRKVALETLFRCPPGVYALGIRLIDARSRRIRLYDLSASRPQIAHHHVNGRHAWTSMTWHGFRFSFREPDMPELKLSALYAQWRALRAATQRGDHEQMLALDPIALGFALRGHGGSGAAQVPAAHLRRRRESR